jgi:hypothetical protein
MKTSEMAGKSGAGRQDRIHIHGQRFDASISENRAWADIKDLETGSFLTMLNRGAVEELAVIAGDALTGIPWEHVPTFKFRASGHADRDGVDIWDPGTRKRFGGLDRRALEELQLLAIELVEMMALAPRKEGWKKWFPNYGVPKEIQMIVNSGILRDTTWEHDAAPNFDAILSSGEIVTLWVENPISDNRISMDSRYALTIAPEGLRAGQTIIETNDLGDLLEMFRKIMREGGGPRLA